MANIAKVTGYFSFQSFVLLKKLGMRLSFIFLLIYLQSEKQQILVRGKRVLEHTLLDLIVTHGQ